MRTLGHAHKPMQAELRSILSIPSLSILSIPSHPVTLTHTACGSVLSADRAAYSGPPEPGAAAAGCVQVCVGGCKCMRACMRVCVCCCCGGGGGACAKARVCTDSLQATACVHTIRSAALLLASRQTPVVCLSDVRYVRHCSLPETRCARINGHRTTMTLSQCTNHLLRSFIARISLDFTCVLFALVDRDSACAHQWALHHDTFLTSLLAIPTPTISSNTRVFITLCVHSVSRSRGLDVHTYRHTRVCAVTPLTLLSLYAFTLFSAAEVWMCTHRPHRSCSTGTL